MRTKGIGPQGLGISKASPLKQTKKPNVRGDLGIKQMAEERKKNKKKYRDVVQYKGESQLNKPVELFFNPGTNRAHGMGGTMDRLVEGTKNIMIPGRYLNKLYKAYKYKNRSR